MVGWIVLGGVEGVGRKGKGKEKEEKNNVRKRRGKCREKMNEGNKKADD